MPAVPSHPRCVRPHACIDQRPILPPNEQHDSPTKDKPIHAQKQVLFWDRVYLVLGLASYSLRDFVDFPAWFHNCFRPVMAALLLPPPPTMAAAAAVMSPPPCTEHTHYQFNKPRLPNLIPPTKPTNRSKPLRAPPPRLPSSSGGLCTWWPAPPATCPGTSAPPSTNSWCGFHVCGVCNVCAHAHRPFVEGGSPHDVRGFLCTQRQAAALDPGNPRTDLVVALHAIDVRMYAVLMNQTSLF